MKILHVYVQKKFKNKIELINLTCNATLEKKNTTPPTERLIEPT